MHQERKVTAGVQGWESSGTRGADGLLVYAQGEAWNKIWETCLHEHECSGDLLASPGWACELFVAQQHHQQKALGTSEAAQGVERDQTPAFA